MANGTRPDVAFSVNRLSQYCAGGEAAHFKGAVRILQYLNATKNLALTLGGSKSVMAYSDADYASDPSDRRSTTGCLLLMGGAPIHWRSQKQRLVAMSTTEAELYALVRCALDAKALTELLNELGEPPFQLIIKCDNESVRKAVNKRCNTKNLKQLEIRQKVVTHNFALWNFAVEYVRTGEQLADILTKPLQRQIFERLRNQLLH